MKGNLQVRFLGEEVAVMPLPYPTPSSESPGCRHAQGQHKTDRDAMPVRNLVEGSEAARLLSPGA
jgi:hypothetical protein